MRREVLSLVRDGASGIDGEALARAARAAAAAGGLRARADGRRTALMEDAVGM